MVKSYGTKLLRNKKGSLLDLIFLIVVITVFAIIVLVSLNILTALKDQIGGMTDVFDADTISHVNAVETKYKNTMDTTFLFFAVAMALVTLVLAALVRVHPIFIPFFFVGWVITIFLSGIFSNIYQEAAANAELAATASELMFIHSIMNALPIIIGIFGILLMFVMYKLWSVEQ